MATQPQLGFPGLTQQELESRLWAAANSLRGPVDPADFKAYILPLLSYKRVSDTWDEEQARALADYGTDLTPEIEADYHRFQIPGDCHWRDLRRGNKEKLPEHAPSCESFAAPVASL